MDPARFLKAAFEVCLIGLFFVCLAHSFWVHGTWRTLREFVAGFCLTAMCESVGVLSGAYVYPGFHFYVWATPVANPASWVATVYIIIEVTNRIVYGPRSLASHEVDGKGTKRERLRLFSGSFIMTLVVLALCDAFLALAVDLVLDPLATVYNWWIWVPCEEGVVTIGPGVIDPYNFDRAVFLQTPTGPISELFGSFFPEGNRYPTRVLGIPLINFVAWLIFVFVFTFEFRWVESKDSWGQLRKTAVLWALIVIDVPVLAFLLITPNL